MPDSEKKPSVLIIGGGGSGLAAAHALDPTHQVTVLEAADTWGGHLKTVTFDVDGSPCHGEAGAEFFNKKGYPNFIALLNDLEVKLEAFTLVTRVYAEGSNHERGIVLPPYYHLQIPDNPEEPPVPSPHARNGKTDGLIHRLTRPFTGPNQFPEVDDLPVIQQSRHGILSSSDKPKGKLKIEWRSLLSVRNLSWMLQMYFQVLDQGRKLVEAGDVKGPTLEEFLDSLHVTESFKTKFLYVLLSGGWGVDIKDIKEWKAYYALKFIIDGNDVGNYEWLGAANGFGDYIEKLMATCEHTDFRIKTKAHELVQRTGKNGKITYKVKIGPREWLRDENGRIKIFDHVIVATNARDAAEILNNVPGHESVVAGLQKVDYFPTTIVLHGDESYLPESGAKVANMSWNGQRAASSMVKIWQGPDAAHPIIKSWIRIDLDDPLPAEDKTYFSQDWWHPKMNKDYVKAREIVIANQGRNNIYVGSFLGDPDLKANDSHECSIAGGIHPAKAIMARDFPNRPNRRLGLFFPEYREPPAAEEARTSASLIV